MPSEAELKKFNDRFNVKDQVDVTVNKYLKDYAGDINKASSMVDDMKKVLLLQDASISKNMARIREDHLIMMYSAAKELGLSAWKPDLLSDPDSLYNIAHEQVCLITFRRMLSQNGYSFMGALAAEAKELAALKGLYRSYVFNYLYGQAMKEARTAGRVAQDSIDKAAYDRRKGVSTVNYDAYM